MRVLIVDDEPLAQKALANILAARKEIEHFDSANDALEALEKLASDFYDVLLLDISMPELSGTELVDRLRGRDRPLPSIVFVTAPDEYAIEAFEKRAVDYVLKPFSNERIGEALDRASRSAQGERAAKLIEALPQLQKLSRSQHPRIAIKAKGRILFIDPAIHRNYVRCGGQTIGGEVAVHAAAVHHNSRGGVSDGGQVVAAIGQVLDQILIKSCRHVGGLGLHKRGNPRYFDHRSNRPHLQLRIHKGHLPDVNRHLGGVLLEATSSHLNLVVSWFNQGKLVGALCIGRGGVCISLVQVLQGDG